MSITVLLRGGGDLASGVALRLYRAGLPVIITELPQPLVVRRLVSFAEAIYRGEFTVEGATARRAEGLAEARKVLKAGKIPILVDPECEILQSIYKEEHLLGIAGHVSRHIVLVDGRMTKRSPRLELAAASLVIGLGPGFVAGENCDLAIETKRGHFLGRVIRQGSPEADTGIPESVAERQAERVLRAPVGGLFKAHADICDHVEPGQLIGEVDGQPILAPFRGVLRGLLQDGMPVSRGLKIGDLDPREDPRFCVTVSDKSLAIGGGVLEAILSRPDLRPHLWDR
jgi:xanthine dehydrogenase accessory factor